MLLVWLCVVVDLFAYALFVLVVLCFVVWFICFVFLILFLFDWCGFCLIVLLFWLV